MLFHTVEFLFFFLPATLLGYYLLAGFGVRVAIAWLAACSLFFYGWWSPRYLLLNGMAKAPRAARWP
jgi:alginate O-acetyltransferase complex protein AlgI